MSKTKFKIFFCFLFIFSQCFDLPTCTICHSFFNTLNRFVTSQKTIEILKPIALKICTYFKSPDFCESKLNRAFEIAHELGPLLNGTIICAKYWMCLKPKIAYDSEAEFTKRILQNYTNSDYFTLNELVNRNSSKIPLKVMTIADAHIQLDYMEGKSTVCNHSLCCGKNSPYTNITSRKAGRFGHQGCDLPNITVESFISEVFRTNPDMILWLGDNMPHNMADQKRETQLDSFKYMANLLKGKYKGKVYAVLGNHDGYPEGQFDIHAMSDNWLTKAYADELAEWLTPESYNQFSKTGYYSQLHPDSKLRIICLNTFVLDFNNVYLWGNATNPMNSLAWLEQVLMKSEKNGESVFIIGHIASQSNSGVNSWTYRYTILVERYAKIIRGQFYGHIHSDFFFIMKDHKEEKTIGVTHMVPALTTDPNPSYRIYDVDPENYDLIDYTQYRLYLDEANRKLKAEWKIAYKFREFYQVPNMRPYWFQYIILRMESDAEYFKRIYKIYRNEGNYAVPEGEAKEKLLCLYKTWNMYEHKKCMIQHMKKADYEGYYGPNTYIIPNWSYAILN